MNVSLKVCDGSILGVKPKTFPLCGHIPATCGFEPVLGKPWPTALFVNRVFLEHTLLTLLCIVSGCFHATKAELSRETESLKYLSSGRSQNKFTKSCFKLFLVFGNLLLLKR